MSVLSIGGAAIEFGATRIFEDVTFTVGHGDRWGIIGRNGSGKTTLFRLITGELAPTRGTVGRLSGLRTALLDQHRDFADARAIWEAAAAPFAGLIALEHSLAGQAAALADDPSEEALSRYDRDLDRFGREGGCTFASRVDAVLLGLGFDPEESRSRPPDGLSGGERGRLGLARQIVAPADLLLLGEPTNYLDVETIEALDDAIEAYDGTVLLVSHDRALLRALVTRVWAFEEDRIIDYAGSFPEWEEARLERERAAATADRAPAARPRERPGAAREDGEKRRRAALRGARTGLDDAESRVAAAEARVAEVTARLEDPELYATPEGSKRAQVLGGELATVREDLEAIFQEWAAALEVADALAGQAAGNADGG